LTRAGDVVVSGPKVVDVVVVVTTLTAFWISSSDKVELSGLLELLETSSKVAE
jgi:hypothetical protein